MREGKPVRRGHSKAVLNIISDSPSQPAVLVDDDVAVLEDEVELDEGEDGVGDVVDESL